MSVPTKTYFLCPINDFIHPPPAGPLCLGSIIRSTSTPQYPLNRANVVAVADAFPPAVENNWKKTVSGETGLGFGVFAQFLQKVTGVGTEVTVDHSTKAKNTFAFETVTTLSFEPTQEYVREAIKAPAVQAWLREPKQRFAPFVSLFLVTAIKLVKGAKIKYSTTQNTEIRGSFGIDATPLGAPGMTFGPKGHWKTMNDDETEVDRGSSEFVFAFRVKKLKFWRDSAKAEDYNKGAFMSVGEENGEDAYVLVEDVDGSDIKTAQEVLDVTENGSVFCASAA